VVLHRSSPRSQASIAVRSWTRFKEEPCRAHCTTTSELPSTWLAPVASSATAAGGPAAFSSSLNLSATPPVSSAKEVDFTSRTRTRSSAKTRSISLWKSPRRSSRAPEKASRRFSTCISELRRTSEQTSRAEAREVSRRRVSSSARLARTVSLMSSPSPPIPDSSNLLALTARPPPAPGAVVVVAGGSRGLRTSITGDAARLSAEAVSQRMDPPVLLLRRSSEASVDEALQAFPRHNAGVDVAPPPVVRISAGGGSTHRTGGKASAELTLTGTLPLLPPPENAGDDWAEALWLWLALGLPDVAPSLSAKDSRPSCEPITERRGSRPPRGEGSGEGSVLRAETSGEEMPLGGRLRPMPAPVPWAAVGERCAEGAGWLCRIGPHEC